MTTGWQFVALQESGNALSPGAAALVVAGMFLAVGLVLLYSSAWDRIQEARMYLGMETFDPVASVADDELLAVRGPVAASDDSVLGPLTGSDCVAFVCEDRVLERQVKTDASNVGSDGSNDDDTRMVYSWGLRDATQEFVPFEVETDHGAVAVEPGYAELDLPERETDASSLGSRILYRLPLVGHLADRPTKTVEKHAKPGDTVTVVGDIQPTEDPGAPVASVRGAGGRGEFTVTGKSGTGLVVRSLVRAALSSLPALLCFAIAVGAIAVALATGALP